MPKHERTCGERAWRASIIVVGLLGGFAAVDALLLFLFLLLSAIVVEVPGPYIGLVLMVLPCVVLVGGGLAWVAYTALVADTSESAGQDTHVQV